MRYDNYRLYGNQPYRVVLVHGGPGALGSMGYLANDLSAHIGIIEALQTKSTIDELILELYGLITHYGDAPLTIVGHSWGAWLAYMLCAKYPDLCENLVLIGSGPFDERYVKQLESTRLSRLNDAQKQQLNQAIDNFYDDAITDKDKYITEIGQLMSLADTYEDNGLCEDSYYIKNNGSQHNQIWSEATELRRSGELHAMGTLITCKVIVIHGDYDPHPVQGVVEPLQKIIDSLDVYVLENCGHTPWREKHASRKFFKLMHSYCDHG